MIQELKDEWTKTIERELRDYLKVDEIMPLLPGTPPSLDLGDVAFPFFQYSKLAHKSPVEIAKEIYTRLSNNHPSGEMILSGAYLNVKFNISSLSSSIIKKILEGGDEYGSSKRMEGKKIMVEFSCPNTNKPLHLGHMRNDSLGEATASLLKSQGAEVKKVNLINNRGVHICKSMLSYKEFGNGETPKSTGEKGDHFVGRYYVKFNTWEGEEEKKKCSPLPSERAQEMLKKWEDGDKEVRELWSKMNSWTLSGLEESYKNMNISFDKYYYESDTYTLGREEVLKGVKSGVFTKEEDGSVQVDLSPIGLDKKVLLRKDGTTLYITQDIGTAISRHSDYPFDSLIYVVASEQEYHFKVLFYALEKLGYSWAKELKHLSYGMVNLPEGKMKSREGTVVDADDLLNELTRLAKEEIVSKGRENEIENTEQTSHDIALGALNYYLLQVSPKKDMIFNPKESISFNGNTGPYLQYMGARISSILRKAKLSDEDFDGTLLIGEDEKTLIKLLDSFPSVVEKASKDLDPSLIATYLYDTAKTFSHYYHDNRILNAETKELSSSRLYLVKALLVVLRNGFRLLGIPFLEKM